MEERHAQTAPSNTGRRKPNSLEVGVSAYHAKALRAETRLLETLDLLDEIERANAEQLAVAARREKQLKQKMRARAEASRQAEEERDEMRQAVLNLIEKVESSNSSTCIRASHLYASSLLEPIHTPKRPSSSPEDADDLLSYAASMIEVLRRERDLERKGHQKTREWTHSRIATLEAQLARRETELSRCLTHCVPPHHVRRSLEATDEPFLCDQMSEVLDWAVARNRTLEVEINALSEKLSSSRSRHRPSSPKRSPQHKAKPEVRNAASPSTTSPNDHLPISPSFLQLDEQIKGLETQVKALGVEREEWRSILDSEKLKNLQSASASLGERLAHVEEQYNRLHSSEKSLRLQFETYRTEAGRREAALKEEIDALKRRPSPSAPPESDLLDHPPAAQLSEPDLLDDGEGEKSMDLATPLIPVLLMEPPSPPESPPVSPPGSPPASPTYVDPPSIPLPPSP